MSLSAEAEALHNELLSEIAPFLPGLPELPALLAELLHQGHSQRLSSEWRSYPVGPRTLLVQALAHLRRAALLRRGQYGLSWHLLGHITELLRSTLALSEADLLSLFAGAGLRGDGPQASDFQDHYALAFWPLWVAQVEKTGLAAPLPPALTERLHQLLAATEGLALGAYQAQDLRRLRAKIQAVLNQHAPAGLPVVRFDGSDAFGQCLNEFVAALLPTEARTRPWLHLLQLLSQAGSGRPTARQEKALAEATAVVGPAEVRAQGHPWLALLAYRPLAEFQPNGSQAWAHQSYLRETNLPPARALLAVLAPLADEPLLRLLADLAARCLRKLAGSSPLSLSLGNAALLALSQQGLPGVAHLAALRPIVAQENTKALITNYLGLAAASLDLSTDEIEDLGVPDYGLRAGQARFAVGEYEATLALRGSKAELSWAKAGKALKTTPATVRTSYPDELRRLKATQAQVQQTYAAQRERLDRSFLAERRIGGAQFAGHYLAHGLLGPLVRGLIWRVHRPTGAFQDALCLPEGWLDARGQPLALPPTAADTVQLWHPVLAAAPAEVLAWRTLLESHQLCQPLKQAFREVYLLTPPEERTRTYSNRMAAHILRQHQFCALARGRGWQFRLLGAYDKGYESDKATLALPDGLRAEFWVSEVNADGAYNPTGIWNYVSTDQVRFVRGEAPVPLPEVPLVVFSEVMRDVDLFVGVASVGNDPAWRDNGGLPQFRDYWESYSFGELGEVAKNRRLALERLVPRLKIGRVSELIGNFLEVKGHRRTYKIHLGSSNILMKPNDQYLCIVPDRSAQGPAAPDVFLPFEGDTVLSIILSKALLLMDDDKITDETILRQL